MRKTSENNSASATAVRNSRGSATAVRTAWNCHWLPLQCKQAPDVD